MVKDREAWRAAVHEITKRHNSAAKQQPNKRAKIKLCLAASLSGGSGKGFLALPFPAPRDHPRRLPRWLSGKEIHLPMHETREMRFWSLSRERFSGGGNGNPLQYSWLENSMDRRAWWATVHGLTKSQAWLSDFTFSPDLLDMDTYESRILWLSWIIDPQGKMLSMKQIKTKGKIWQLVLVMLLQTLPSTHSYIIIILV